jgi:hypothetical protein
MLRLLQFEELEGVLLDAPAVLGRYEARDFEFASVAVKWMQRLEKTLGNNRITLVARVAVLRAHLQTNRRGSRAERDAATVEALKEVVAAVHRELEPARTRFAEAETVARRVLALAEVKGLIPEPGSGSDIARAHQLYDAMREDSDLIAGAVQMSAIAGKQDALIVLSRRLVDVDAPALLE